MNVDVLVDHLVGGIVVANLRRNQIISRVNAHVWFLWVDVALDEDSKSATVTSDNESALSSTS